jgi:diguanylate cyclase (GGDEF)-like protein/PAS domain S-box-containing protein
MKNSSATKQALPQELASPKGRITEREQSERRQAEEALRMLAFRNEAILAAVPDIIVEVDESKRYTWSNQAGMQFFGEDLIGQEASYYFEGVQETYDKVQPLFNGAEEVIHVQSWQRRKDGEKRLLSWWCKVLKNEKGLVIGALSTGRDITELYHAEAMLQEQLHFSQQLLDAIPIPIFYKDRLGMFRGCNTAYEKFVGMTKEQVIGKTVFDIAPQDLAKIYYQADEVLFTQPGTQVYETSFRHADGNVHDIIFHKATYVGASGCVAGLVGVILDVTERKRDEVALQESEAKLNLALQSASMGVWQWDIIDDKRSFDDQTCHLLGLNPATFSGEFAEFLAAVHPDDHEKLRVTLAHVVAQDVMYDPEYRVIWPDGSIHHISARGQLVRDIAGHPLKINGILWDITALKKVEENLRQNQDYAERLAKEMAIMAEIGRVISSTLNIEEVYQRFAAEALKLISFDSLVVNLKKPRKATLDVAYASGADIPERRKGDSFPLKGSVTELVMRTRTGLIVRSEDILKKTDRFSTLGVNLQAGLQSMMSVPLISRNEAIGALVFRAEKQNAYNEQDLSLAEKIGMQISGAIANAELYMGLMKMDRELKESEQRYRELSIVDDLTQLYNSRHFYFQLKIELDRANRYEQPLTLLLLDLDDFKAFNDTYGHVAGDQVLQRLGQVVKRCLRETDFAYRYGGEEFTILLPMTTSTDGTVTAERIRTEFKRETFSPAPGQDVHKTVSIGLAQYKPQEEMKAFVHRVDQLMYQGKKNGKDRVCSES